MKNSLDHLPEAELSIIRKTILELGKPVMVILFGSYSRGDWVEDKYTENGTTYESKSDYDFFSAVSPLLAVPSLGTLL